MSWNSLEVLNHISRNTVGANGRRQTHHRVRLQIRTHSKNLQPISSQHTSQKLAVTSGYRFINSLGQRYLDTEQRDQIDRLLWSDHRSEQIFGMNHQRFQPRAAKISPDER